MPAQARRASRLFRASHARGLIETTDTSAPQKNEFTA
jgi:hypothetical protein